MKIKPYKSAAEYYNHQLQLIDTYMKDYMGEFVQKMYTSGKEHLAKAHAAKNHIAQDEINNVLNSNILDSKKTVSTASALPDRSNKHELRNLIEMKVEATLDDPGSNVFIPLEYLCGVFDLSEFEKFAVFMSFAVEVDRKYEKVFGYFNDYVSARYPTIQTVCLIYDSDPDAYMSHMTVFHPESKLMKYFFEEDKSGRSGTQLKLHDTIVSFLFDSELETIVLPEFLDLYLPDEKPSNIRVHNDIQVQIRSYLSNYDNPKMRRVVLNLNGPSGIGRLDQVKKYCHDTSRSAIIMNFKRLSMFINDSYSNYITVLKKLAQALLMHQAVLVMTDCEVEEDRETLKAFYDDFLNHLAPFVRVTFILSDKPLPAVTRTDHSVTVLRVKMDFPTGIERKNMFEQSLSGFRKPVAADITAIASKFVFTPDQIANAAFDASELSRWHGEELIDSGMIHQACRSQLNHNLDKRAQRIEGGGNWDKLILPDSSKDNLQEVCLHVKYKNLVLDDWGFHKHLSYGTGLAVLFAGPPGTGKTFSARILAKELDLELYKVDLSQMISKYIGETEKNISELFDDAAGSSAILLFDEGDALFSKRTEMKDSHDRYANVETAFLLQKVEAYEGISILTTNFMQNIDPAFLRRFRFVVHFPIPDFESRLLIWKGIYPEPVPMSKHVDFEFLAKNFELTGGHIKNVALSSAFKAASNGGKVDMKSIMLSIQHELGKTGKAVLRSDFGEYAYMLDE